MGLAAKRVVSVSAVQHSYCSCSQTAYYPRTRLQCVRHTFKKSRSPRVQKVRGPAVVAGPLDRLLVLSLW